MTSITELVFGVLFLVNGFNYEVESRTETTCVARSDVDVDARDAVQFSLRFLFIKFGIRRPPIVLVLFVFFFFFFLRSIVPCQVPGTRLPKRDGGVTRPLPHHRIG